MKNLSLYHCDCLACKKLRRVEGIPEPSPMETSDRVVGYIPNDRHIAVSKNAIESDRLEMEEQQQLRSGAIWDSRGRLV
jgi:hypothetical protein